MPAQWFHAKWSGSHEGNKNSGWSKDGIDKFNELFQLVKERRATSSGGVGLDKHLRDHWKGALKERERRAKQPLVVAARDDGDFDTKYAEV